MSNNSDDLSLEEAAKLLDDDELSLEEAESLLQSQDTAPKRRVRKSFYDDRTIQGWLHVYHTSQRNCEVVLHDEERPRNKGMCTIIDDIAICRICFLEELDKLDE